MKFRIPQSRLTVPLTLGAAKRTLSARPDGPRSGTDTSSSRSTRPSPELATEDVPWNRPMPFCTIAFSSFACQVTVQRYRSEPEQLLSQLLLKNVSAPLSDAR